MGVDVHVNTGPDEVYVAVNYATTYYQFLMWGQSDVPGLTGTGNWYYGTTNDYTFGNRNFYCGPSGGGYQATIPPSTGGGPLFWADTISNSDLLQTSFIHGNVDGTGWHGLAAKPASSYSFGSPLLALLPNTWNGEAVLLPYPVYVARASSKWSLVADLKHIRMTRNTFLENEEIITLGADRWMIYPQLRKEITVPAGGNGVSHSGTLAYAIRYTGP